MILSYGMVWYGMLCTVVYYLSYVFDGISVVTIRLIFQFECHYSIAWLGFFVAIAFLFSELFANLAKENIAAPYFLPVQS